MLATVLMKQQSLTLASRQTWVITWKTIFSFNLEGYLLNYCIE